jgi:penicillin-binding protein 2
VPWRGEDHQRSASFTRRSLLISSLQVAGFGVLAGRLFQLQVLEGQYYAPLAENNRVDVQFTAPIRGRIFDRKGVLLAGNEEAFALTVIPVLTGDLSRTLNEISRIVPMTAEEIASVLEKEEKSAYRQLVIDKPLSFEQVAALNVLAPQLPGVECKTTYQRRYFKGRDFSHVVGYMGRVAEHALDDDPALRLPGMRIGKIGIELGCEEKLRGKPGRRRYEVDARGRIIRDLETRDAVQGEDIRLTIDAELQSRVMSRLSGERRAALVVMNVENGDVLSLASVPSYDSDAIARSMSQEDWKELSKAKDQPLFNRAIRGLYPPGSTLKMVTALAALEKGVIDLKEKINCSGEYQLAEQTYRCWKHHGHGRVDLHQALRESCDCYFYEAATRCGIKALSQTAEAFGLGATFDCGLPLQKKGVVPTPDWKRWAFNASWLDGETVLTGIGQGYVSATPLQLAVMTARLATGRPIAPRLVRDQGRDAARAPGLKFKEIHLSAVREAMLASVYEPGGTGHRVQIAGANFAIAGKTGTSQVRRNQDRLSNASLPWEQRDHALFTCYFPFDRPRYSVTCVVEHGGSGGKTAAPLVRDVIKDIVDYDRTAGAVPDPQPAKPKPRRSHLRSQPLTGRA